jgi:hypothetical protein
MNKTGFRRSCASPLNHSAERNIVAPTDKELLELAAKAAGIAGQWKPAKPIGYIQGEYFVLEGSNAAWRPFEDEGDALRLAVKLRIEICYPYMLPQGIDAVRASTDIYEAMGKDPYAATRRAIVRAAAEIGKQKD